MDGDCAETSGETIWYDMTDMKQGSAKICQIRWPNPNPNKIADGHGPHGEYCWWNGAQQRQTSLMPFLALLDGRQSFSALQEELPGQTERTSLVGLSWANSCWMHSHLIFILCLHHCIQFHLLYMWTCLRLVASNLVAAGLVAFFLSAGGAVRPSWMAFARAI
jgi:hypothetical protein